MEKYLAIFLSKPATMNKWMKKNKKNIAQVEKEGITAWKKWAKQNKKNIVAMGNPLGNTLAISIKGISKTQNEMTGWTVVRAKSHIAAAKMFKNHPHFTIFPGDAVEVMECLEIPGA